MKDILIKILQDYSWVLGILAIVGIEVSPIKINPISFIGKILGKINSYIHKDIYDCQKQILNRLDIMEKDSDFKDVMEIKNKLCNYKVMLQTSGLDEFQYTRCFELIERYKFYQNKYPGEVNGHMNAVIKFIETQYNDGIINESFKNDDKNIDIND